jgi:hypothetical protein
LRAWRRPTLPHLGVQYHRRRGFSRPSSGWDRVFGPSLWPPGRQGRSPEGGGPSARGSGGRRSGGLSGGLSCAGGSVFVRPWAPVFTGGLFPADAGKEGLAAMRGGVRRCCERRVQAPIERLVPVSCAGCPASTSGLSTWWSSTALQARPGFEEGFPLRCVQRLSRPHLATRRCGWRHNRYTRGASLPVLSYWGERLASLEHPRQIGTELSHDVLNPAHVPL